MADVVNLRLVRKRAQRRRHGVAAQAHRLQHGVRKAERSLRQAQDEKARRVLDQHRIETGDI